MAFRLHPPNPCGAESSNTPRPVVPDSVPESALDLFYRRPILNSPYVCPRSSLGVRQRQSADQSHSRVASAVLVRLALFLLRGRPATSSWRSFPMMSPRPTRPLISNTTSPSSSTAVRRAVDRWRTLPEREWRVTAETARLLRHWRYHRFTDIRPFFSQVEAVETIIWLTDVHPRVLKLATWVRLGPFSNWPTPVAAGASKLPRPSTQGRILIEVEPQPKRFHGTRWLTATLDCAVDRAYAARAAVAAMEP